MLVVSAVDYDLTTTCVFMHNGHCDYMTECYEALTIVRSYLSLLTLSYWLMLLPLWLMVWLAVVMDFKVCCFVYKFFPHLCQIVANGGSNGHVGINKVFKMFQHDGVDRLLCRNHLTYGLLLLLLLFALWILLGDMVQYLCQFMKITSCSCFSQNFQERGL